MELIRQILLKCEQYEHGNCPPKIEVVGYSDEQVAFHIHLMGEAGLLKTVDVTSVAHKTPAAMAVSMTWQGYEFLDAARSDSLWTKAVSRLSQSGVSVGFELFKQLLTGLAKDQLQKHGWPLG
ncbi:MAG TPA: DUF2513 domain-containing protein [Candidatus Methylomirabilis sp.]|nr:DUF2513 domain-containing protein [Candidatus Methylomirabilis sp.]